MSKSRRNNKDKCLVSSRETLVDWGALFNLIGDELDACTNELRQGKRMIWKSKRDISHRIGRLKNPPLRSLRSLPVHSVTSTM